MKHYIPHSLWCLLLLASSLAAADLQITPTVAVVETGKTLTLSMTGTDRPVTWVASKGQVQSAVGYQATYTAPPEAGIDSVIVKDDLGNHGVRKIIVVRAGTFVPENANWKVFANRRTIAGLLLSEDKETLWVATTGGLEQRDTKTNRVIRFYTTQDGLPHNFVQPLLSDNKGGLWVGTQGGLVHLLATGKLEKINLEWNQKFIVSLTDDGKEGIWVAIREGGLVHLHGDLTWEQFTTDNSQLPDNSTYFPVLDGIGGLWVGTRQGLAHLLADSTWQVFNTSNSPLPDNWVVRLVSDGNQGLWLGTGETFGMSGDNGGVAHFKADGSWEVFNTSNSKLPGDIVWSATSDLNGGMWVGTTDMFGVSGGLAHFHSDGTVEAFTPDSSQLPNPRVSSLYTDNREGVWVGTGGSGLAYLHTDGTWDLLNTHEQSIPDNMILAIDSDGQDGIWVGVADVASGGGLAHLDAYGLWQFFLLEEPNALGIPLNNTVWSVAADGQGGVWAGIGGMLGGGGLTHFHADGSREVFTTGNSQLPADIIRILLSDGQGGVWLSAGEVATGNGLAHLLADGSWEIFNTTNSKLPDDRVSGLDNDGRGGVWIGTMGGLAHLLVNGNWEVFTTSNSQLPEDSLVSLASDNHGGVWVGTLEHGVAHLQGDNTWQVFHKDNSKMPNNGIVKALLADDRDGVWVGTFDVETPFDEVGGLVHLNPDGTGEVFTIRNSGLPDSRIVSLKRDNKEGIWVGTAFGLAYLTLSKKPFLCTNLDDATCDALLKGNRAAIIIAGGGNEANNTLWDTTESITNSIYQMLYERGFENNEIYYLSPKLSEDFNDDGGNDRVVDAPQPENPLQVSDVQQALEWAKGRGKLDQPLYLFLVDHGAEDSNQKLYFKLSSTTPLEAGQLKGFLDEYTAATSSPMVMVIDACWSGALMEELSPSANRAIISSSEGSGKAYFYAPEKQGFSRFLAESLGEGKSFGEAFDHAKREQQNILPRVAESSKLPGEIGQVPQFNDGGNSEFRTLFVNGNFPRTNPVSIKELVSSGTTSLAAGQKHLFKAQVNVTQGYAQHVWAVLKPPRVNLVLDNNGTPILDLPLLTLSPTVDEGIWEASWRDAVYNGEYELTFYAEDNQGHRASSSPVTVTVTGGTELPAQAEVQVMLTPQQEIYKVKERLTIQLTEGLSWGYDLYVMVTFPDGSFATLTDTNQFQPSNQAKKWMGKKSPNSPLTLIDMELVEPLGSYCVYGILSPAKEDFLAAETKALQVEVKWCAEVVKKE